MKALTVTASILLAVLLLGIGWLPSSLVMPATPWSPWQFAAATKTAGTAASVSRQLRGHRSICRPVSASLGGEQSAPGGLSLSGRRRRTSHGWIAGARSAGDRPNGCHSGASRPAASSAAAT
jgi:hypothetical protein